MGTTDRVIQVGWDCHRKSSQVTARDDRMRIVRRWKVSHGDRDEVRTLLRSWPLRTPVVLEGSFGWSWIADEIESVGHRPHLASTRKLAAWRTARGMAKSNRLDADLLSELMSEKTRWWEVWLPPREVRDQRELLRYRMALVATQTAFKNRIHALLHRHGILHDTSDLFGGKGRRFLQRLVNDPQRLRSSTRMVLKGHLQLLDQIRRQIARATREFRRQVQASPIATRLKTLPGVKWILAYTLLAEIGRIERFPSHRHLASYSRLAPIADDSGEDDGSKPLGRHVGFSGRDALQWAFIEASHAAVRKDAQMRATFNRVTDNGKTNRGRGYVAVARRLCVCAYVIWKKECEYARTPARPGSEKRRVRRTTCSDPATSRPGTGLPVDAMVASAALPSSQTFL